MATYSKNIFWLQLPWQFLIKSKMKVQFIYSIAPKIMENEGTSITRNEAYFLLQECGKTKDVQHGRQVQVLMIQNNLSPVSVLGDHLIRLFTYHGCFFEANQAFDRIVTPSAYSWAALILANAKHEQGVAINLYQTTKELGVEKDKYIYVAVLKACASTKVLMQGRAVHCQIIESMAHMNIVIASILVDMYAKCGGSMEEARIVFDKIIDPDVVLWGALVTGYAQQGESAMALECFGMMQREGTGPDKVTFLGAIKANSRLGAKVQGRYIHEQLIACRLQADLVVSNSLIDMYSKCASMEEACKVFDGLPNRDVVSWSTIITAYFQDGKGNLALEYFARMQLEGIMPDKVTFLSALKACSLLEALQQGVYIHEQILEFGLQFDVSLGSTLVDMYAKFGRLEEAYNIFVKLPTRDVVSWNTMIAGYALNGESCSAVECFEEMQQKGIKPNVVSWGSLIEGYAQYEEGFLAIECFQKMQEQNVKPDGVIFLSMLKACTSIWALQHGKLIHELIIKDGLQFDFVIGSTLVDMYAKCGSLKEARKVFENLHHRDAISWNAIIAGYTQNGESISALQFFERMQQTELRPDHVTFASILRALACIGPVGHCRLIHEKIVQSGISLNDVVGATLVNMYSKWGSIEEAKKVFEILPNQDVVPWNAMISGHVLHGENLLALECFEEMQTSCIKPDEVTFSNALKACTNSGAIGQGRFMHEVIIKCEFQLNVVVGSTLVNMYGKCGSLLEARRAFDSVPHGDVVAWNAMIAAYAQHGDGLLAVECFETMQEYGIEPNDISFTIILFACSHAGLLDKGRSYFRSMIEDHGITPSVSHCTCMADLLGRAGCLNEAEELLIAAAKSDSAGWMSLLNACKMHGDPELGKRCFDKVVTLN